MQCPRCRGLMVPDQFFDLINDGGYWTFDGWRCLCCGNILDPVILRNQQAFSVKGIENAFSAGEGHEDTLSPGSDRLVSSAT
jgi:hypothetical protein